MVTNCSNYRDTKGSCSALVWVGWRTQHRGLFVEMFSREKSPSLWNSPNILSSGELAEEFGEGNSVTLESQISQHVYICISCIMTGFQKMVSLLVSILIENVTFLYNTEMLDALYILHKDSAVKANNRCIIIWPNFTRQVINYYIKPMMWPLTVS